MVSIILHINATHQLSLIQQQQQQNARNILSKVDTHFYTPAHSLKTCPVTSPSWKVKASCIQTDQIDVGGTNIPSIDPAAEIAP